MVIFNTPLKVILKAIAKNLSKNTKKNKNKQTNKKTLINTKEGRKYQTGGKDKQNADSKIVTEYQHNHKQYYKR